MYLLNVDWKKLLKKLYFVLCSLTLVHLNCSPSTRTHKIIAKRSRRPTYIRQIRDQIKKALGTDKPDLLCIFCVIHFDLFFRITFQIAPEPKCTQKNRMRLVEHSCSEVSDPFEVPWFVRESIFKVVQEVKLICVRLIISCLRVPAIV